LDRALERWVLRHTALALFTDPSARESYRDAFPFLERTEVLFNGIDHYVESNDPPETLTWAHAGSLYRGRRSLAPILEAMAELRYEVPMKLVLIGGGVEHPVEIARSLGIEDRLECLGPLPVGVTLRKLAACHRLVVVIAHEHGLSIPGKLFDYFSTLRPILLLADPVHAAATLLHKEDGHAVVSPLDPHGLRELVIQDYAALRAGGIAAVPRDSLRRFEAGNQMGALAGWLAEL
jgi:glycosyltransferase involved in cell wall biosynthesis